MRPLPRHTPPILHHNSNYLINVPPLSVSLSLSFSSLSLSSQRKLTIRNLADTALRKCPAAWLAYSRVILCGRYIDDTKDCEIEGS